MLVTAIGFAFQGVQDDLVEPHIHLDAALTVLFTALLWVVILDMARVCLRRLRGRPLRTSSETPYLASRLEGVAAVGR